MARVIFIYVALLVLAGCGTPVPPPASSIQAQPSPAIPEVQATQAARAAEDSIATLDAARQMATAAAAAPAATATAEAQATAYIVTATAVRQQAAMQDLAITRQHLDILAAQAQAQATAAANERLAENDRMLAADEARRLELVRQRELAAVERQRMWNRLIPILIVSLVVLLALSLFGFLLYKIYMRPPVQVADDGAGSRTLLVLAPTGEYRPVVGRSALPAPSDDVPLLPAPSEIRPSWSAFVNWQDARQLPIGVDTSGQPILVDRIEEPHVFFAGMTGSGKSSSGLVPFAVGMAGVGVHAIMVNGRGTDFMALEGQPNITVMPPMEDDQLVITLAGLLQAAKVETDRRNGVLRDYNKAAWSLLPPYAGESGEFVLVVDEFLQIVEKAALVDADLAASMWGALIHINDMGRKYGIYNAISATDPTRRALGDRGMRARAQMARVVFRMKEAGASRVFVGGHSDWPNGSVGLPTGQFVANIAGRVAHGVGFHPSADDVGRFFREREVRPSRLPDGILDAIEVSPGVWSPMPRTPGAADLVDAAVMADAASLDRAIGQLRSLRAVGRFLYNLDDGASVSGQMIDERVKPALAYRQQAMNCPHAARLMERASIA